MAQAVDKEYLRKKARDTYWSHHDRDEYTCPDCGRSEKELLEHLEVHHIDGDVRNNDLDNLVGLCQVCHNLREGKRASVRKTKHLIGQFSGNPVQSRVNEVPVCQNEEEYGEYVNECFEIKKPALVIDMKHARKWAAVEVDMLAMEGAFQLTTGDKSRSLSVGMNSEAASILNRILERYKDVETGGSYTYRILSFPSEPTAGFHSFPGMKLEMAKKLASDLKMVLENPMNWEPCPNNKYTIRQHIEEYGVAKVEMQRLEWLPPELHREPWEITEEDLQKICPRCDENPVPKNEEHCETCQYELLWKYSECDHENVKPTVDRDADRVKSICVECGLERPKNVVF